MAHPYKNKARSGRETAKKRYADGGMIEPGNIDLSARPRVYNPDGSISTVRSIGVNIDNQEVLIPTVKKDPFHPFGGHIMSNEDSERHYRKTGHHLGKFSSPRASDAYARGLHEDQDLQYRRKRGGRAKR